MDAPHSTLNPYWQALKWIESVGLDAGGGSHMAKLVLSLYNAEFYAISAGDCLPHMDPTGKAIALRCLAEYAARGETAILRQVGKSLTSQYPDLKELCAAAQEARAQVRRRWADERRRACEAAPAS